MSVLASRLDRASETYRANLRLLEELAEQLAQSTAGGCERYVARHWYSASHRRPATQGGEGHGRLRRVPDVSTNGLVANRGEITTR
jgi:hypothetical protein